MTLNCDVILRARSIAILVVGAGKVTVMERVAECLRLGDTCDLDLPLAKLISSASVNQLAVYKSYEGHYEEFVTQFSCACVVYNACVGRG